MCIRDRLTSDHVSLFNLTTNTYIRTFAPTDTFTQIDGATAVDMYGSTIAIRPSTANSPTGYDLVIYNTVTGAELRRLTNEAYQSYFSHDGSALVATRWIEGGANGTRIYVLDAANLPSTWSSTPAVTLPPTLRYPEIKHVFGTYNTGIRLVVSVYNDVVGRNEVYGVNTQTQTFFKYPDPPLMETWATVHFLNTISYNRESVKVYHEIQDVNANSSIVFGTINTNTLVMTFETVSHPIAKQPDIMFAL